MNSNTNGEYKKAEDYALGSILDYRGSKTVVKTSEDYWTVYSHGFGWLGSWHNGEVNMGLHPEGSLTPVYDNGK